MLGAAVALAAGFSGSGAASTTPKRESVCAASRRTGGATSIPINFLAGAAAIALMSLTVAWLTGASAFATGAGRVMPLAAGFAYTCFCGASSTRTPPGVSITPNVARRSASYASGLNLTGLVSTSGIFLGSSSFPLSRYFRLRSSCAFKSLLPPNFARRRSACPEDTQLAGTFALSIAISFAAAAISRGSTPNSSPNFEILTLSFSPAALFIFPDIVELNPGGAAD